MGFLTTTLTVTIVKKDSNVHHQETDDGKVHTSSKDLLHALPLDSDSLLTFILLERSLFECLKSVSY